MRPQLEKGKAEILDLSRVPLATSIATTAAAEEEEDEEDDDEDVSKYDLMAGSDDETPPTRYPIHTVLVHIMPVSVYLQYK